MSPTLGFNIRTIIHRGYTLSVCASTASRAQSRSSLCSAHTDFTGNRQGTLAGRLRSGRTGATISNRRTRSSGSSTRPTAHVWTTASGNCTRSCRKRYVPDAGRAILLPDSGLGQRAPFRASLCSIHGILIRAVVRLLFVQRLLGASLLVFVNKQDIQGALSVDEISQVRPSALRYTTNCEDSLTDGVSGRPWTSSLYLRPIGA